MHILIVEDDRQLRQSLARGLREAGYAVDQAADGEQALTMAQSLEYAAIILDLLLPRLGGIDVCRQLRHRGATTPILMLTALDAVEQRIAGLDAGADDYLTKPFDFGELLARVRALTRRRGGVLGDELAVGDLIIDASRQEARRGERVIALTTKEFEFLQYLARNAGRIVSRAELMSSVWDDARGSYSNVIDVYASRLRRKIDDGEPVALLSTHRRAGFMLDAPRTAPPPARRKG